MIIQWVFTQTVLIFVTFVLSGSHRFVQNNQPLTRKPVIFFPLLNHNIWQYSMGSSLQAVIGCKAFFFIQVLKTVFIFKFELVCHNIFEDVNLILIVVKIHHGGVQKLCLCQKHYGGNCKLFKWCLHLSSLKADKPNHEAMRKGC